MLLSVLDKVIVAVVAAAAAAAAGVLTGVVHAGLDDVVHGEAAGRLLVAQAGVHLGRQHLGHVVVVLAQVGVLLLRGVVHLQLVVGVSERHGDVGLLACRGTNE